MGPHGRRLRAAATSWHVVSDSAYVASQTASRSPKQPDGSLLSVRPKYPIRDTSIHAAQLRDAISASPLVLADARYRSAVRDWQDTGQPPLT